MLAMRKAAGVMVAVMIASVGLAGTASATGGLNSLTVASLYQSSSTTMQIQGCCLTFVSLSTITARLQNLSMMTIGSSYFSSSMPSSITSFFQNYLGALRDRYCPSVPEPTAALAFATGLLVLSRGMRRRS